jgi:hypothetical protein
LAEAYIVARQIFDLLQQAERLGDKPAVEAIDNFYRHLTLEQLWALLPGLRSIVIERERSATVRPKPRSKEICDPEAWRRFFRALAWWTPSMLGLLLVCHILEQIGLL